MPNDYLFWCLAALASLLVGASKGGLPLVGMLAVPIMSLVMSPVVAAGLLLPIYILSDLYGLWLYRSNYVRRIVAILVPAAALGILLGWLLASRTDENLVKLLVGAIGLVYCADAAFRSRRSPHPRLASVSAGIFWGVVTGFTSFVSHAGGPPYQMYVLPHKLEKLKFAGTATVTFAFINALKLPPYWQLGQVSPGSLPSAIALAGPALIGAWAGHRLTHKLPEKLFFRVVEVALFVVSIKLVWDSVGTFI